MRIITCFQYKDQDKEFIKKVEVRNIESNITVVARREVLNQLALEYQLIPELTSKEFNKEGNIINTGIFYARPIRDNSPAQLSNIDIDYELEKYERNIH